MSRLSAFKNIAILLACTTFVFTSCGDNEVDDCKLPDGKYPITFATAVEGLTVSRAATADGFWTEGDRVAVKVESNIMEYAVTNINSNNTAMLKIVDANNSLYWQNSDDEKIVSAWYCGKEYLPTLPKSLTVQTDQRENGYKESDFLYAAPQKIAFRDRENNPLIFKHLPAKVVIHLTNGDGLTADDVKNATIRIVNQETKSGEIDWKNVTVLQATNSNKEIIPNVLVTPQQDYQKSVQALVVPQQMKGNKFIKVTIGTGTDARHYYYTPKGNADANLEYGKQYTYNITVKKTGLSVEPVSIGQWIDNKIDSGSVSTEAKFHITLSGSSLPEFVLNGIKQQGVSNIYETINSSSFSFSFTVPSTKRTGFSIQKGIANEVRTTVENTVNNTTTYTFSYTNVRSDLWLKYGDYPEVGDYYYDDGSFSSAYTSGGSPACIGIVFKVGVGAGDGVINYNGKLPNGIRGYVVALNDAFESECAWGGDNVLIETSSNQNDYLGYNNSRKIVAKANEGGHLKPDNAVVDYPAMFYISTYGNSVPAPSNSSGWYFPSTGQLSDIYRANTTSSLKDNVSTANGTWFKSDNYLSSSEYDRGFRQYNVGSFSFRDGSKGWKEKDDNPAYVRAILTF